MSISKLAGKLPPKALLEDIPSLVSDFFLQNPSYEVEAQRVKFGTSGHRGSSTKKSFNEDHILAISQAICEYRKSQGIYGTLFIGKDTHALSTPAELTALRVFAANGVKCAIAQDNGYTPTPVISHAILTHNKREDQLCDGIVITPSHNPPSDGGFKYNSTNGGPADTTVTKIIEERANEILKNKLKEVKALPLDEALKSNDIVEYDFVTPYVEDLVNVIDIDAIKRSGIKIAADALGGSGMKYYEAIKERYGLNMTILHNFVDEKFSFMSVDHDGKIRMDCSSPYAMNGLVKLKDDFDIAFGNDTDFDRHGIVTPTGGLMNPNHYLSVAIWYLATHRPNWSKTLGVGKTLVSSAMIDRVAESLGREVKETPVGFKWFVDDLYEGRIFFGGEESAGASFLRIDGEAWSTDKDGIILSLLSAEILAVTGKDPQMIYDEFTEKFGKPFYKRIDVPATPQEKAFIKGIKPNDINRDLIAGKRVKEIEVKAKGNNADIGGLKVVLEDSWFAVRPSGTEDIYKIYVESFESQTHLEQIIKEVQEMLRELSQKSE